MDPLNLRDFTPTMSVPVFTPYSDFGLHQLHCELSHVATASVFVSFVLCCICWTSVLSFSRALGILIVRLQNALYPFADGFLNLVWSYQMALLWLSFLPGWPPSFLG